jgi:hypothetical protein
MENFISLSNEQQRIYRAWVFTPIVAHILSGLTGFASVLLFPILVTVGYYIFFKQYPSFAHPARWFFTLPLTFYIWVKWGPAITSLDNHNILPGVVTYYIGQFINAFAIPLLSSEDYSDDFIGWLVAQSAALIIWLVAHTLLTNSTSSYYSYEYFIIYPVIGLIAQSLSGFFLFGRYIIN